MPRQPVDCDFRPLGGQWQCRRCGIVRECPVRRNCGVVPGESPVVEIAEPPWAVGVALWQALEARWIQCAEMRSWEEIEALVDACGSCPHYTGCGCSAIGGCEARDKHVTLLLYRHRRCNRWPD